jgi:hypothetical protein
MSLTLPKILCELLRIAIGAATLRWYSQPPVHLNVERIHALVNLAEIVREGTEPIYLMFGPEMAALAWERLFTHYQGMRTASVGIRCA